MKVIKKRIFILGFMTLLGMVTTITFSLLYTVALQINVKTILLITFFISILLALLCINELKKLRLAQLIKDNTILHIFPVISWEKNDGDPKYDYQKGMEVLISYFGILLGANIIKYNQDNIKLKSVEVSRNFISITYGKDKQVKNTRIYYPPIEISDLNIIVSKFLFETGIKPTIIKF